MEANPPPDPLTSMWSWLAHDLRMYRERARMTGETFGKIMGVARSTVSRFESGEYRIKEEHARALDKYFSSGGHFFRLLFYAKLGHDPDWFREHVEREAKASVIRIFEHSVVPGLLQTEAYARAIFKGGRVKKVDEHVTTRMMRQSILARQEPPELMVILNESVLDLPVGGRVVMAEQLARLAELSQRDDVLIRVVPRSAGFHVGMEGAIKLLTVGREESAYAEAWGGGRLILDLDEVRYFSTRYEWIGALALPLGPSQSLIDERARAYL